MVYAAQPQPAACAHGAALALRLLKAMAHRERLAILVLLAAGPLCVGELERQVGMRQAALSQQLAKLRADGIVDAERQGRHKLYRIQSAQVLAALRSLGLLLGG